MFFFLIKKIWKKNNQEELKIEEVDNFDNLEFSEEKMCSSCEESTLPADRVDPECEHTICSVCLFNKFEDNIVIPEPNLFQCPKCLAPFYLELIKKHLCEESINEYLLALPKIPIPCDLIYYCPSCHNFIDKHTEGLTTEKCQHCPYIFCKKCGNPHQADEPCIDAFYRIEEIKKNKANQIKYKCIKCKTNDSIILPCECKLCRPCLVSYIRKRLESDPFSDLTCETCTSIFPKPFLDNLFYTKAGYSALIDACVNVFISPSFTCLIC